MGWDLHSYVEKLIDGVWVFQPQPAPALKNYAPYPGEATWRDRQLEDDYWDGGLPVLTDAAWNEPSGPTFCALLGLNPAGLPHDCSGEVYARYAVWLDSVLETYVCTQEELRAAGIKVRLSLQMPIGGDVRVVSWCCATTEAPVVAVCQGPRDIETEPGLPRYVDVGGTELVRQAAVLLRMLHAANPVVLRADSVTLQRLRDKLLEAQHLLWLALRSDEAA